MCHFLKVQLIARVTCFEASSLFSNPPCLSFWTRPDCRTEYKEKENERSWASHIFFFIMRCANVWQTCRGVTQSEEGGRAYELPLMLVRGKDRKKTRRLNPPKQLTHSLTKLCSFILTDLCVVSITSYKGWKNKQKKKETETNLSQWEQIN